MHEHPYLIFALNHSRYAVEASAVQELFFLPQITPIAGATADLVGVINLRNEVLPILNLHRRLGHRSPPYQLSDSIIVLQTANQQVGILVNQVYEVELITAAQIDRVSQQQQQAIAVSSYPIRAIARLEDTIVSLLDVACLTQAVDQVAKDTCGLEQESAIAIEAASEQDQYTLCAHLSNIDRQTLRQRADNLRQALETQDATDLLPLAVVGLGGEYFGLGLETVHEFAEISKVTPVPCCPTYVVGNMNLRGEIITLIDIRHLINVSSNSIASDQKAIVVRQEQLVAAITVDEIFDVTYVHPSSLTSAPVAVHSIGDEYLQGVASYQNKMMSIINLAKVLSSGTLVVNEEV